MSDLIYNDMNPSYAREVGNLLIERLAADPVKRSILGPLGYIKECRTISATFPRESGVTTYIRSLLHTRESLLFVPHIPKEQGANTRVFSFARINSLASYYYGKKLKNPIECFLIDDSNRLNEDMEYDLHQFTGFMAVTGMLHPDFFILKMGT